MNAYNDLQNIKRGQKVTLRIAYAFPIRTMDGTIHGSEHVYKVLGLQGTLVRLSRIGDCAKLTVTPDMLINV